jgi:N-acyl homoserine lactone hydrolase
MLTPRALLLSAGLCLCACSGTTHPAQPASLGAATTLDAMERVLDTPGPVVFETVVGADWVVPLEGLLNLADPNAVAAGLAKRDEPIQIYVHVVRHPTRGVFLVDSGVSSRVLKDPDAVGVGWVVQKFMKPDGIRLQTSTDVVVAREGGKIGGVFLTHAHLDHILGLPDIGSDTPVFVGKGEGRDAHFQNLFTRGSTDGMLRGKGPLQEWPFDSADAPLADVIDVLGDASVFALNTPGHTPGSTAYVVRSTGGPVLLTGDTCHTRWGWEHAVEPGGFSVDGGRNRASLLALKGLAQRHPGLSVRFGHQP